MNDRNLFLKVYIQSESQVFQSNLLHSIIVERKKVFLKRSCLICIAGIPLHRLVLDDKTYIDT